MSLIAMMYLTKKLRRMLTQLLRPCLALIFACSTPLYAALPGSYDVEVVIFTVRHPGDDGEHWPTLVPEEAGFAGLYSDAQLSELPVDSYRLNGISNGLRQSSAYDVVFHKAWRQPAYDSTNAIGYPVAVAGKGGNNINGNIRLTRERFLHLDADLLMVPAGNRNAVMDTTLRNTAPVFALHEKRRIKSNVVHYFDHPRFGIIATVTPYVSPAEAQQLIEEEDRQAEEVAPVIEPLPDDDQLTR
jgi:hypothetical protein